MAISQASSSDCFIELVREDDGVNMHFRRKGPTVDGQAFFCLVQSDCHGAEVLFDRVKSEIEKLKLFSVQCDSFHHTGVVECGFATMKRSVGRCRLKNIAPNTPYYIAIAFHMDKLSIARIDHLVRRDVEADARRALSPTPWAFPTDSNATAASPAPPPSADITLSLPSQVVSEEAARRRHRAGLDFPILDKIQLRELKEHATKIRAIFKIHGRSPWRQFVLPSYECAMVLAFRYTEVLVKQSRQKKGLPVDHRFLIYGVGDPLTGFIVSLVQQLASLTIAMGAKRLESTSGCILDGLSALGTRHASPSLKGPWIIDWYDFLLLVCCDDFALRRIYQCAMQFNGYDVEGQTLGPRMSWMVKPENVPVPRGSLLQHYVDTCKLEPKEKGSGYIPAPITAGRAIWAMMPHRQQLRASRYAVHSSQLAAYTASCQAAKKETLHVSIIQPMLQRVRRAHAKWRLQVFIAFLSRRQMQQECLERKRLLYATLLDRCFQQELESQRRTRRERFHWWKRIVIYNRLGTKVEQRNLNTIRLNHLRKWRLFVQPQYRIAPDSAVLPPLPPMHIHRFLQVDSRDGSTKWVVLSQFGSKKFEAVIDVTAARRSTGGRIIAVIPLRQKRVVGTQPLFSSRHRQGGTSPSGAQLSKRLLEQPQLPGEHEHVEVPYSGQTSHASGLRIADQRQKGTLFTALSYAAATMVGRIPRSAVQMSAKDWLMIELLRLSQLRIVYHRFWQWRALVELWMERRRMQQRQSRALRTLLSSSRSELLRMVYHEWKKLAEQRLHHAQIHRQ